MARSKRSLAPRIVGFALTLVAGLQLACAARAEPPVLEPLKTLAARRPVVLVPGVTGGKMREVETGKVVWGEGRHIFSPKDGGYALARPLIEGPEGPRLESFAVIEEMSFFGFRKQIYGPIVELMEANGYQTGDLTAPRPEDSFFLFAYDWRGDLVAAAAELAERLEAVREARGAERLEVDLICQSAGGQICRYLAKYGAATLEAVEAGDARPGASLRVAKVILVGTANGGSMRILRELHRGRTYFPGVGRKWRPEVLFTFPSLYQDLPVYREDLFLDASGQPLEIDLFDPETWTEYGFSIFAEDTHERVEKSGRPDLFGEAGDRLPALDSFLSAGLRLHAALERDVDGFDTRYYSIQNVDDETPDQAVLVERPKGGWDLLFTGDKQLSKMGDLHESVATVGDGHAAEASQDWLSPQEQAAMSAEALHIRGDHFKMILDPAALQRILEYLAD
jgi:hypothetical protein